MSLEGVWCLHQTPESCQGKRCSVLSVLTCQFPNVLSQQAFYLNFRYPSSSFSAEYFTARGYEEKSLKCIITNFHVFMRKHLLQTCAEQLISGVNFQIGQNNQYEIVIYLRIDKSYTIYLKLKVYFPTRKLRSHKKNTFFLQITLNSPYT